MPLMFCLAAPLGKCRGSRLGCCAPSPKARPVDPPRLAQCRAKDRPHGVEGFACLDGQWFVSKASVADRRRPVANRPRCSVDSQIPAEMTQGRERGYGDPRCPSRAPHLQISLLHAPCWQPASTSLPTFCTPCAVSWGGPRTHAHGSSRPCTPCLRTPDPDRPWPTPFVPWLQLPASVQCTPACPCPRRAHVDRISFTPSSASFDYQHTCPSCLTTTEVKFQRQ